MKTLNKLKSNVLEKLGLSVEQAQLYRALLEYGPLSPSDLVRKTGIHRPAVYKVLPELIQLELVSMMPKGKYKLYVPESPQRLEKIFETMEDEFNTEIHHLHEVYEARGEKPVVTFTEGERAIISVFEDVVHELPLGSTYYRYSPRLTVARDRLVPRDYRSLRDKKQLERLVITDQASLMSSRKRLGKSVRAVPDGQKLFEEDVTQVIYGNKVSFIDYNSKTVVTIENEKINAFQKKLFKLMWKQLEK